MNRSTALFEEHRPNLLHLAYHMLGRLSEAEDVVQDAYIKWQNIEAETVRDAGAYLSTIVSRLCLDELKSARNRREQYIGPDLPDPILTSANNNPEENTQIANFLSMGIMFMLEKLNPVQRAVFILREVFSYPYSDIADIVAKSETNSRKIAQRARDQMQKRSECNRVDRSEHQKLLKAFVEAVKQEDLYQLESLLAKEATLYSDGGGKVSAPSKPIYGENNIARFMLGIAGKAPKNINIVPSSINGEPGLLIYFGEELQSVWTIQNENDSILEIFSVLNPQKLAHIQ